MRILLCHTMLLLPLVCLAQVEVDTHIQFTGTERRMDGLAAPTLPTSAITVEGSLAGVAHWSVATVNEQVVTLEQPVPVEQYRPGILLRFILPADLNGPVQLRTTGLAELPLLRSDGLDPVPGQLRSGMVVEVVNAVDRWIIISPSETGCAPGSLQVHERLCMDIDHSSSMSIYAAMDHCQAKGGKLCTWDEYYLACTVLGDQLVNRFQDWEWLDETSNHTHTADQAGRYTCKSQRSSNPVLIQGRARCCYHPR